jgi:hypothetical protein
LTALHKLFWVALRTLWSGWTKPLVLVTPRTVVSWHRAGFRLYWTWVSRARQVGGRKRVSKEARALLFRMVAENPSWGAPRIHGELLKLGFELSERSVSRWIRRAPRDPDPTKRWLTFLRNHREAIAAMPWQNGVAERWVGSCRRDLLDHVIVLNERHLKRLMSEYVLYYHQDRTHLGLAKDTPAGRPTARAIRSGAESKIQSLPRLGGLHHRYAIAA